MKNEKRIWSEIRTNNIDEETGITTVDAWLTGNDNEEGCVIATIDDKGFQTYIDFRAKSDKIAQEVIQEAVERISNERHTLVDKVIERLKQDFLEGDFTVIDEILVHNVSMAVLRGSLPDEEGE